MPRKVEKGILGYRKDPRNQVLFSFNPRDGDECPSSDSEDSDYFPSDDDRANTNSGKSRKPSKTGRKTKKMKPNSAHKRKPEDQANRSGFQHGKSEKGDLARTNFQGRLPPEIWLRIFQFVVELEGALPFLVRAAKVCHMWHELSQKPLLWEVVDLSYGWIKSTDETLTYLAVNRLGHCHSVSLSSWKKLTSHGLKILAENCRQLKSINLSYCKKVTSPGILALVDNCSNIEEIDVSFTSSDAVSVNCLKQLSEKLGSRLRHLTLGGNLLKGFTTVLSTIMKSCPNLELLDVSNALFSGDFVSINIEKFQVSCPKMKVLRLTNSKFRGSSASRRVKDEAPGFPQLEQLSLAVSTAGLNSSTGFDDDFVNRILKSSVDLRLLDLRGCTNISTKCLRQIPVLDLQQLHLSQTPITKNPDLDVVLRKWQHSLTHMDLSWTTCPDNLDKGVSALAEGFGQCPLEYLSVAGTSVGVVPVKNILEKCTKLTYIDLSSCRSLPRGVKREFQGRKNIVKLKEEFSDVSDSELESLPD